MDTREIKAEIKMLALAIRAGKIEFKKAQREGKWEDQWRIQPDCRSKSRRCRHLLIAYGMMRGLEYERIERPREDNKPDWAVVEEIRHVSTAA
jgi:hypothetical protein